MKSVVLVFLLLLVYISFKFALQLLALLVHFLNSKNIIFIPGIVVNAFNPYSQNAEAGRSL